MHIRPVQQHPQLREDRTRKQAEALALPKRERWDAYVQYKRELTEARAQRRERASSVAKG